MLAEADLVEGNSKIQGAEAATRVIGPSVGGLVVATVGLAAGLVVDAFTFAFCFVCIWLIRVQETVHRGQNQREPLRRQIALGLRFVAGDPYLRSIVVYGTLLNFGLTGYSTIQIVFLEKTVGVGEFGLGLLLAIAGVGGIVGSMIARRARPQIRHCPKRSHLSVGDGTVHPVSTSDDVRCRPVSGSASAAW